MSDLKHALYIAGLWRAGKMIGGDEEDISVTLLNAYEAIAQQRDELLEALESLADNERYDDGDPRLEKARELARNAITKTKGAL